VIELAHPEGREVRLEGVDDLLRERHVTTGIIVG